ncbi:MAG: repeat-associated core protein, partial [Verrucomicrobia bacterium]|nr:repeat-associated core protein [Verrucomicrobiota bacterium]
MGVTDVNSWTQCWCRRALWLGLGVGALAAPRVGAQVFVWDGGDYVTVVGAGHTTISSGETLNITLSADHFFVATALVNNGTTNWQDGGPLRAWSGASYTNNAAFNDQNVTDAVMYPTYDNSLYFSNSSSGVYTKSGAGTTTYNVVFNNDGTVIVQSGTLAFAAGGANNGTFVTSAGAKTQFLNDYTLNAGSSLTGAGNYALDGGTATFNGTVTVTHLLLNSGAMGGTQTFNNSTLEWTGTSLGTSGTTIIGGTSVLNISGSGDKVFNLRAVVNNGTTNWTGGPLRAWSGGSLTNNAAFNDQNSSNAIAYPTYDSSFYFQNSLGATYTK